jgi:hypothetical protein
MNEAICTPQRALQRHVVAALRSALLYYDHVARSRRRVWEQSFMDRASTRTPGRTLF